MEPGPNLINIPLHYFNLLAIVMQINTQTHKNPHKINYYSDN